MKNLTDFVSQIVRASLEKSPDQMLGDFLDIAIDLSDAEDGSIIGEYGPYLYVLYSKHTSQINTVVPWDSREGQALQRGVIMYTPPNASDDADTSAFPASDEHILTIPLPSVYHEDDSPVSARFTKLLNLRFRKPIFQEGEVSAERSCEFTFEQMKEKSGFDQYLANVFVLLPILSFGMEIKNLRRTSYQAMHEVKNKFFSVDAWLKCLQEDIQDSAPELLKNENVRESFDLASKATQEGVDLSKNSLLFTQIYTRHFQSSDVNEVVQQTADDLKALASSMGSIQVTADLDQNLGAFDMDPHQLRIALFNIGKNGIDALAQTNVASPCLRIRTTAIENGHAEIIIEDNNGGLPDEIAEGLFVPFNTAKEGGTGLGLTITKKIIDGHNGTIECDTGQNGTRFTVRL